MKKLYWYKITHIECPMCGRCTIDRERIYGEKPKDPNQIYFFKQDTICANFDVNMGY